MSMIKCDDCDGLVDSDDDPACFEESDGGAICSNCRQNRAEAAYERQQERLMEDGPGPSLLEQQQAAYKIKHGLK